MALRTVTPYTPPKRLQRPRTSLACIKPPQDYSTVVYTSVLRVKVKKIHPTRDVMKPPSSLRPFFPNISPISTRILRSFKTDYSDLPVSRSPDLPVLKRCLSHSSGRSPISSYLAG